MTLSYTTSPDLSNISSSTQPQIVSQKHFNTKREKSPLSSKGGGGVPGAGRDELGAGGHGVVQG